jgi:hypothetical protein
LQAAASKSSEWAELAISTLEKPSNRASSAIRSLLTTATARRKRSRAATGKNVSR